MEECGNISTNYNSNNKKFRNISDILQIVISFPV